VNNSRFYVYRSVLEYRLYWLRHRFQADEMPSWK